MNHMPFHLPDDLSPELAMALFELLSDLTDALWRQYETALVELLTENHVPASQEAFDFNDDLPF